MITIVCNSALNKLFDYELLIREIAQNTKLCLFNTSNYFFGLLELRFSPRTVHVPTCLIFGYYGDLKEEDNDHLDIQYVCLDSRQTDMSEKEVLRRRRIPTDRSFKTAPRVYKIHRTAVVL